MWVDTQTIVHAFLATWKSLPATPPVRACLRDSRSPLVVRFEFGRQRSQSVAWYWRTSDWRLVEEEGEKGAAVDGDSCPNQPSFRDAASAAHREFRKLLDAACLRVTGYAGNPRDCLLYEQTPLSTTECPPNSTFVPLLLHSTDSHPTPPYVVTVNSLANPRFRLRYRNDSEADRFMRAACGPQVYDAYRCLRAPSYRADLFRMCVLWKEGGVYLDSDLLLASPLSEVVSLCSPSSVGNDFPAGRMGKQMKILSGVPKAPLFRCMLDRIVANVKAKMDVTGDPLRLTGPSLLQSCYSRVGDGVAVTYFDSRGGVWPHSGLRTSRGVVAFETSSPRLGTPSHYDSDWARHHVYTDDCPLHRG